MEREGCEGGRERRGGREGALKIFNKVKILESYKF